MKKDLKSSVRHYLEAQQLNEEQIQALLQQAEPEPSIRAASHQRTRLAAMALTLVVAFAALWTLINSTSTSLQIAEEVAYHHLKMKPLEISGHSVAELQQYFRKLDFELQTSTVIDDESISLLGGRYCSIQGVTAAQLRLQNRETDNIETLYQAPFNKELFQTLPNITEGHPPVRHYINGVAVDVWTEKGILYAHSFND